MRRNERVSNILDIDYRRERTNKIQADQYQHRRKSTDNGQMKSLECSSVQEVYTGNQSHEMSWLQKLVNNMDDDKQNSMNEQMNRNFSRKNSSIIDQSSQEKRSNSAYLQYRNSLGLNKNELNYTPISKISQLSIGCGQSYSSKFVKDPQRPQKKYRELQNTYMKPLSKESASKQIDLNQSLQGYGRIKRVNKIGQRQESKKNIGLQNIQIAIPKHQISHEGKMKNNFYAEPNQCIRMGLDKDERSYYEKMNFSIGNRREAANGNSELRLNYETRRNYEVKKYEPQNKNEASRSYGSQYKLAQNCKQPLNEQKKQATYLINSIEQQDSRTNLYERKRSETCQKGSNSRSRLNITADEQVKMDQMAKRLNMVLENINKKSKLFSDCRQKEDKLLQQVRVDKNNLYGGLKEKMEVDNKYYRVKEQKENKTGQFAYQSRVFSQQISSTSYENYPGRPYQQQKQELKYKSTKNTVEMNQQSAPRRYHDEYTFSAEIKKPNVEVFEKKKCQLNQRRGNNIYSDQPKWTQDKKETRSGQPREYQVQSSSNGIFDNRPSDPYNNQYSTEKQNSRAALRSKQDQQRYDKYELMKRSLGMSKHIPQEIILEQSSSQIISETSPRTEFLHRQLKNIFERLDREKSGELSKNNCALEELSDEIKYIFGGLLAKVKCRSQKTGFKQFFDESVKIAKQFQFEELKQILCKSQLSIPEFKFNEKLTESQRWPNDTHQIESKRSSERSEVVKKYQFNEQRPAQQEKIANHCIKVHWAGNNQNNYLDETPALGKTEKREKEVICEKNLNEIRKSEQKNVKVYEIVKEAIGEKQNVKIKESQKQKKDFEKMCENLNNKLNNYLTTINKRVVSSPKISLEFSELSKHWGTPAV